MSWVECICCCERRYELCKSEEVRERNRLHLEYMTSTYGVLVTLLSSTRTLSVDNACGAIALEFQLIFGVTIGATEHHHLFFSSCFYSSFPFLGKPHILSLDGCLCAFKMAIFWVERVAVARE